jgi:hypothetical protein
MNDADEGARGVPVDKCGPMTRREVQRMNEALLAPLMGIVDGEARRFANMNKHVEFDDVRQEATMILLEEASALMAATNRPGLARTIIQRRLFNRFVEAEPEESRDGSIISYEQAHEMADGIVDGDEAGGCGVSARDMAAMSATISGGGCFDDDPGKTEEGLFDRIEAQELWPFINYACEPGLDRRTSEKRRRRMIKLAREYRSGTAIELPQARSAA